MAIRLLFSLGFLLVVFSMSPRADDGSPAYIPTSQIPFKDYVQINRDRIRAALKTERFSQEKDPFGPGYDLEKVVEMRAPFEDSPKGSSCQGEGAAVGFLYIHGLSDSPYHLKDIYESIHRSHPCAVHRGILLPGHGTVPEDQLTMKRQDWLKVTRYGVSSFGPEITKIILVGFSTGTSLSMRYMNEDSADSRVAGLVFLAPAVKARSSLAFMTAYLRHFLGFMGKAHNRDAAKYESFAYNSGAQFYLLTIDLTAPGYKKLSVPVFMAASGDDQTVNSEDSRRFFCQKTPEGKRQMLWYKSAAPIDAPMANCDGIEEVSPESETYNTFSIAHTAITSSPNNLHYGFNKAYKNCLAYDVDGEDYKNCLNNDAGSVYAEKNLGEKAAGKFLRRGTFNPHFDTLTQKINAFLTKTLEGNW